MTLSRPLKILEKDGTVSIHVKNLQKLTAEIFKISKNFCVPLTSELFHQKVNHCNLRNPSQPAQRRRKNVLFLVLKTS